VGVETLIRKQGPPQVIYLGRVPELQHLQISNGLPCSRRLAQPWHL
jgi:hypothetical protein